MRDFSFHVRVNKCTLHEGFGRMKFKAKQNLKIECFQKYKNFFFSGS